MTDLFFFGYRKVKAASFSPHSSSTKFLNAFGKTIPERFVYSSSKQICSYRAAVVFNVSAVMTKFPSPNRLLRHLAITIIAKTVLWALSAQLRRTSLSSPSVAAGSTSPSNHSRVTSLQDYSQHSKQKLRNLVHLLMHVYIVILRLALLSLEMQKRLNGTSAIIYGATIVGLRPVLTAVSVLIQMIPVNKTTPQNKLGTLPDPKAGKHARSAKGSLNCRLGATIWHVIVGTNSAMCAPRGGKHVDASNGRKGGYMILRRGDCGGNMEIRQGSKDQSSGGDRSRRLRKN